MRYGIPLGWAPPAASQSTAGNQDTLSGLVATERISSPGDGGGPVVDDQNRLIGLLVASSPGQSMVLPIKPLLEKQGLTLVQ